MKIIIFNFELRDLKSYLKGNILIKTLALIQKITKASICISKKNKKEKEILHLFDKNNIYYSFIDSRNIIISEYEMQDFIDANDISHLAVISPKMDIHEIYYLPKYTIYYNNGIINIIKVIKILTNDFVNPLRIKYVYNRKRF